MKIPNISVQKQLWHVCTRYILATPGLSASVQLITNEDFSWLPIPGTDAYICNLWVIPLLRRKGLANALLARAEEVARRNGCKRVSLFWDSRDTPEYVLDWYYRRGYKERGFEPFRIYLYKDLYPLTKKPFARLLMQRAGRCNNVTD